MFKRFPKLARLQSMDRPTNWRPILTPVTAPWSRLFEPFGLVWRNQLELYIPRDTAKVIDDLVLHNSNEPGSFRTTAGVTFVSTNGCQQSFVQQILGDSSIAHAHQGISIKVIAVTIQPFAWIESLLHVSGRFHAGPPGRIAFENWC